MVLPPETHNSSLTPCNTVQLQLRLNTNRCKTYYQTDVLIKKVVFNASHLHFLLQACSQTDEWTLVEGNQKGCEVKERRYFRIVVTRCQCVSRQRPVNIPATHYLLKRSASTERSGRILTVSRTSPCLSVFLIILTPLRLTDCRCG